MDTGIIGQAIVAALCDAVAEVMTDQHTDDEKVALLSQLGHEEPVDVESFYEKVRSTFRRDPGNAVFLFFLVFLGDIRAVPVDERPRFNYDVLYVLEAAHRRGYITDEEAVELVGKVG